MAGDIGLGTPGWASRLQDLRRRRPPAPRSPVGDGALGFGSALDDVGPGVGHQLCRKQKAASALEECPILLRPAARDRLHAIMYAPDRETAGRELEVFREAYRAEYPKAVAGLARREDDLLRFPQIRPCTGCTFGQPTRSIRGSALSGPGPGRRAALVHAGPGWPWPPE